MEPFTATIDEPPAAAKPLIPLYFLLTLFLLSCQAREKRNHLFSDQRLDSLAIAPIQADTNALPTGKKKIYLTFDDGPNRGTSNVLDIIRDEKIPVSFFVIGLHTYASSEQKRLWDSLQQMPLVDICNHSYTHAWHNKFNSFYQKPDSVISDFSRTAGLLNLNNIIVRMPGRNAWRLDSISFTDNKHSKAAIDSVYKAGFQVLGWDLEWHFNPKTLDVNRPADKLVHEIDSMFAHNRTRSRDNLVLLAHDQAYRNSADSIQLRTLIRKLKENKNYEFAIVRNYPGIKVKR